MENKKERSKQTTLARKRRAESEGGGGPAKRVRFDPLRAGAEQATEKSITTTPRPSIPLSKKVIRRSQSATLTPRHVEKEEEVDLIQSRRGRKFQLPTRFK